MTTAPRDMFGVRQLRIEDDRFLTGRGRYVDNVRIPGALRAVFVRSIMPHARVADIHTAAAKAMPGVAAVYVADDLGLEPMPPSGNVETPETGELAMAFGREVLARGLVRFVGEPVAVVLAETLAQAMDAAEEVVVGYEPLPSVVMPEDAVAGDAPLLWPEIGTNVAYAFSTGDDADPLTGAEVVARGRFVNQRLAPVPMEPNAIAVDPTGDGLTVWVSSQVPFDVRDDLAGMLGLEKARVRTIAPDVGGGFGAKLQTYPEYRVVAKAACMLQRPVRWVETRSESMVGLTHGRAQIQKVEIGALRTGEIVGLRVDLLADMGAYPIAAFMPTTTAEMLSGCYRIPRIACSARAVVTNSTPVAPYRGAGRPEAAALIERAMDLVARELGMDPVHVRRRNLIPADAFPYRTASGMTYDVGDYGRALEEALRLAGYEELRAQQAERRARGDHVELGIGLGTYVEITSFSSKEFGAVEVDGDGHVTVVTGTSPHGQGHETSFAQIASAVLGARMDDVSVVHSDTGRVRRGAGTWGSRSLQAGGSSVFERAAEVAERARAVAAHLLEVAVEDVVQRNGRFEVAGAPSRSVSWAEVAGAAADRSRLPAELAGGLRAKGVYREPGSTFPFGTHVAVVEVDTQTGKVRLVRHVAVDDCGRILNPMLVDGQVHGGLAQGIAQALLEEFAYDELGNPMTGTITTYLMPSAAELPSFELAHTQTPTPVNPLGAKGIGESATIGSTPAVQNAVVDALSPYGVVHLDLPASPERVLAALRRTEPA